MLKYLRSQKIELTFVISLVIISVGIHHIWFSPSSVITSSDWGYTPELILKHENNIFKTWLSNSGFGSVNIQLPFYGFMIIWGVLAQIGLSYDAATKITFFIPLSVLSFITPYFLFKKLFNNNYAAFIAAIFYGTTPYGIATDPPFQMVYAVAPLILFLFIRALEAASLKRWVLFSLCFSVGIIYEIRIMYIVTIILGIYFLVFYIKHLKAKLAYIIVATILILMLNAYWLMPTLEGGTTSAITQVANRGLFGNELADTAHALTLTPWYWTGQMPNNSFVKQSVPYILWAIPIFILSGLSFIRKRLSLNLIFFTVVAIIGIFLSKQVAEPIPQAYSWLYANFPGFNLFRESSKFFVLSSFGYAGIIAAIIASLAQQKEHKKIVVLGISSFVILLVATVNSIPVITGEFGGLTVGRTVPQLYDRLNVFLASSTPGVKSYWLPTTSRWGLSSINTPSLSAVNLAGNEWKPFSNDPNSTQTPLISQNITQALREPYAHSLFDESSIKYLILPERDSANDDDFFSFYGDNRNYYKNALDNLPWLEKTISTNNLNVYVNKSAKPFIHADTTLFGFADADSLTNDYDFIKSVFKNNGFSFIVRSSTKNEEPITDVSDIFNKFSTQNISGNKVVSNQEGTSKQSIFYAATDHDEVSYSIDKNTLNISSSSPNYIASNENVSNAVGTGAANKVTNLGNIILNSNLSYYIDSNDNLLPIINTRGSYQLGTQDQSLTIFSSNDINLIPNSSFQKGVWQKKVNDCNEYNSNGNFSQRLVYDSTLQTKVLQFSVNNHIACTSTPAINLNSSNVLLKLDYKVVRGNEIGYKVIFNDKARTVVSKQIAVYGNGWTSLLQHISVPQGANQAKVILEGYPHNSEPQTGLVRYSSASLLQLQQTAYYPLSSSTTFMSSLLTGDKNNFTYEDPAYTYQNLISNASLKGGLWQKQVGDCDAYDYKPELGMQINTQLFSKGSSRSLQLSAKRHTACTGPGQIRIISGIHYLFRFDYQSPNSQQAGYYIGFNDPAHTTISSVLAINTTRWETFTKNIVAPPGATSATIAFYAYSNNITNINYINRYDNFYFAQVPDITNRYYTIDSPVEKFISPKSVSFSIINPTYTTVHIRGATTPFFLIMSEDYDDRWQLSMADQLHNSQLKSISTIAAFDHYRFDDYANAWYVDVNELCKKNNLCQRNSDGSYDLRMKIQFSAQRWQNIGIVVTGLTLITCIAYFFGYFYWKYRHNQ